VKTFEPSSCCPTVNTMPHPLPHYTKSLIPHARKLRKDMTDAEKKLWSLLRNKRLGVKFRRQVPYDCFILDFYSVEARLVIEVDGSQHYTAEGRRKDKMRDNELRSDGLEVLRFLNEEVLDSEEGVGQMIYEKIQAALRKGLG
jgi:very-short-patch-repair endonuclease